MANLSDKGEGTSSAEQEGRADDDSCDRWNDHQQRTTLKFSLGKLNQNEKKAGDKEV